METERARRAARRRAARLDDLRAAGRRVPVSFAIVGVQKAATSSLYRMLAPHPRVADGPVKELQVFAREHRWPDADLSDYARPARHPGEDAAGDASPVYLVWPRALERMREHRPDMRLIASFRDPIERAVSHWAMDRGRHPGLMPDLPDAIATFELDRIPTEVPAGMTAQELRRRTIFTRGLYGQQLERGLGVFPREQWLMLDFRRVVADHAAVLDECTDHLGLERFTSHPELAHSNRHDYQHTGRPPGVDDVRRLVEAYAEDLRVFERLSGLDTSHWPTSRLAAGTLDIGEFTARLAAKLGL